MRRWAVFCILLIFYFLVSVHFSTYLKNRPIAVKLGYLPDAKILKLASAEHSYVVAEWAVVKVLFYFGTLLERSKNNIIPLPDYPLMFNTLETAVKLDPYNMDAYYFVQAAFTWEVGHAKDVNQVLKYGMRHRTWDATLPFYVAFNDAYFLKNYDEAAHYMQKAAEISRDPLFTTLAARFFYEARRNDLGILFLSTMEEGAKDKHIKNVYDVRRKALLAVKNLDDAVNAFRVRFGRTPHDLHELVSAGIIERIPDDPYGGTFYIADDGMIRSTSKFAFRSKQK